MDSEGPPIEQSASAPITETNNTATTDALNTVTNADATPKSSLKDDTKKSAGVTGDKAKDEDGNSVKFGDDSEGDEISNKQAFPEVDEDGIYYAD